MSGHTPGPFLTYGQTVTGPHGVSLAFCGEGSIFGQGYSYSTTKKECRANAVLFAAAPDLLEAAEKVIEMNRQHAQDQYGDPNKAESWSCVMALRAAIARAKGEQS